MKAADEGSRQESLGDSHTNDLSSPCCLLTFLLLGISQMASVHAAKHTRSLSQTITAAFPAPQTYQPDAVSTAMQFMTALFKHQYATMWTMLHPQVQAVWPGKAAYVSYWQTRF